MECFSNYKYRNSPVNITILTENDLELSFLRVKIFPNSSLQTLQIKGVDFKGFLVCGGHNSARSDRLEDGVVLWFKDFYWDGYAEYDLPEQEVVLWVRNGFSGDAQKARECSSWFNRHPDFNHAWRIREIRYKYEALIKNGISDKVRCGCSCFEFIIGNTEAVSTDILSELDGILHDFEMLGFQTRTKGVNVADTYVEIRW